MTRALSLACLIAALALLPGRAHAHPIHTTLSVVTLRDSVATFTIRVFADDFSASVARLAGKPAPRDSSAPLADVMRYLDAKFSVRDASGAPLTLVSCGVRRASELYWLCLRVVASHGVRGVRLSNQLLTELHDDQVNIVQLEQAGARRTMLFTRRSTPAPIL